MEHDYFTLNLKNTEKAIPILKEFIAMCPYSREAHLKLLYCYYCQSDVVGLSHLLSKLMHNMTDFLSKGSDLF